MTLTLLDEPLSTNHVYKHSCTRGYLHSYMTPAGRDRKESYRVRLMGQWFGAPHTTLLHITVTLFFGKRRKRGIDNQFKLILNALTGIVWEDDKQVVDLRIVKAF